MITLSKRLESLVKFIDSSDILMDVGCDHALIDIYLVQQGILNKVYVCDVNPNALESGIKNIERNNLGREIIPVLGYGIEKANEYNINALIISGMGSKNIISILESPYLNHIYKLILQSNNNYYELRKFISSKGYNIVYEEIIEDSGKTYINIIAGYERYKIDYTEEELEFGPMLTKEKENLDYFKKLLFKYENIFSKSHTEECYKKITYLRKIISSLEGI